MSKTIKIITAGYMIQKMPDQKAEFEITIDDNDCIADCIAAIGLPEKDEYIVLVDGKFKPMEYCPLDNERLTILYLVIGG